MFKLIAFFALLAAAFAAPSPKPDPLTYTYNSAGLYPSIPSIGYSNLGYPGYIPYASGYSSGIYNYYSPLYNGLYY